MIDCEHIYIYENSTHHDCWRAYQRMRIGAMLWREMQGNETVEREYDYRKWYLTAYDMTIRVLQPYRLNPGCDCVGCQLLRKCEVPYTGLVSSSFGDYI